MNCLIKRCQNPATEKEPICYLCRRNILTWKKRNVADRLERKKALDKYSNRLDSLTQVRSHGKRA